MLPSISTAVSAASHLTAQFRGKRSWRDPEFAAPGEIHSPINAWEWRRFSQNGEDGILAGLLDRLPEPTGLFVEFGFSPTECNGLNLIFQRGM